MFGTFLQLQVRIFSPCLPCRFATPLPGRYRLDIWPFLALKEARIKREHPF